MASEGAVIPGKSSYSPEVNAHIWRDRRVIAGKLRVGVLAPGAGSIERWVANVLDLLRHEPALSIVRVFLLEGTIGAETSDAAPPFRWLEAWSNQTHGMLRTRVQLSAGFSTTSVSLPDAARAIPECGLDVLVWLDTHPPALECSGLARLGVWSFCFGDPDEALSTPAYWREVLNRNPVSTLVLQQRGAADIGIIRNIGRWSLATVPGWRFTQNATDPLTLAGPARVRRLLDVLEDETVLDAAPTGAIPRPARYPTAWDTARFAAGQTVRSVSRRIAARGRDYPWFVAVRSDSRHFRANNDRFVPDGFQDVPEPEGSSYADPFVLSREGRNWLFVEEASTKLPHGRLVCLELLAAGGFGDPMVVLERPYHLSYPFIVQKGSDLFLLPESAANHSIELYRATRFPDKWELEKELCSNIAAVDTSAICLEGIWYFFTTALSGGNETFLFWSTELDGEWHYHPRNPICTDIRRSRGAGALFLCGGSLMRPVQDCSKSYGYAITLNRVTRISVTDFAEEAVETILPNWRKGLLATHTLNSNDAYEVIDARRFAP